MTVPHGTPDLAALISRLEAARGPDRALDIDIAVAVEAFEIAPSYTASLDAALMLEPKKAGWYVSLTPSGGEAEIFMDGRFIEAKAATPALALCIVSLKARMAT